jgi:hypothetical protein
VATATRGDDARRREVYGCLGLSKRGCRALDSTTVPAYMTAT